MQFRQELWLKLLNKYLINKFHAFYCAMEIFLQYTDFRKNHLSSYASHLFSRFCYLAMRICTKCLVDPRRAKVSNNFNIYQYINIDNVLKIWLRSNCEIPAIKNQQWTLNKWVKFHKVNNRDTWITTNILVSFLIVYLNKFYNDFRFCVL